MKNKRDPKEENLGAFMAELIWEQQDISAMLDGMHEDRVAGFLAKLFLLTKAETVKHFGHSNLKQKKED